MKTEQEWQEIEAQVQQLVKQRKELSKTIHALKARICQHKRSKSKKDHTKTIAWQMFGKRLKDLTAEEYREYYNARQKIARENRKNGIYKRKRKGE